MVFRKMYASVSNLIDFFLLGRNKAFCHMTKNTTQHNITQQTQIKIQLDIDLFVYFLPYWLWCVIKIGEARHLLYTYVVLLQ